MYYVLHKSQKRAITNIKYMSYKNRIEILHSCSCNQLVILLPVRGGIPVAVPIHFLRSVFFSALFYDVVSCHSNFLYAELCEDSDP